MKENEEKVYTVFRKVVLWEEWEINASSHEEAIQKAEVGDFDEYVGVDSVGDNYLYPDDDGVVRYESQRPWTVELYSRGDEYKLIWNNKPISVKRDEKLNELLGL